MNGIKLDRLKLMELKRALPHGALGQIAEELGIHRNNVTKVFQGVYESEEVIRLAIEKIEEKKNHIKELHQRIDQAISA